MLGQALAGATRREHGTSIVNLDRAATLRGRPQMRNGATAGGPDTVDESSAASAKPADLNTVIQELRAMAAAHGKQSRRVGPTTKAVGPTNALRGQNGIAAAPAAQEKKP
jgi:hypothetical protein